MINSHQISMPKKIKSIHKTIISMRKKPNLLPKHRYHKKYYRRKEIQHIIINQILKPKLIKMTERIIMGKM